MKRWGKLISMLLACAMLLALAACGKDAPATQSPSAPTTPGTAPIQPVSNDGPVYGGGVTCYTMEFYNDFDPASYARRPVSGYLYDMLWDVDWSITDVSFYNSNPRIDMKNLTGQLAESWDIATDYSSITVKLRPGVTFQQKEAKYDYYKGRTLTAADVKWSYDRLLGLDGAEKVTFEGNDWAANLNMLQSVEVVDETTVVFHLSVQNEVAVSNFMCCAVYIGGPEWDGLTDDQQADWHYACGTGPFYISEYAKDSYLTLSKNESYWDYDERYPENKLPYLDEVTLVYIDNSSNILSQFISGQVDILASAFGLLNSSEVEQLQGSMDSSAYRRSDMYAAPISIGLKQTSEPLKELKVRQAMQYAINLEEINTKYFHRDTPVTLSTLFHSATDYAHDWTAEQTEGYYTYNPEKAKQLLAEAGYSDGFTFDVVIFSRLDVTLFQLAAEYLKAVGITMNLTVGNTPPEMTSVGADKNNPACVFFNIAAPNIENGYNYAVSGGSWNYIHQDNPELQAALDGMKSATTLDELKQQAQTANSIYTDTHYLLMISSAEEVANFYSARVKGVAGNEMLNLVQGFAMARIWVTDGK